MSAPKTQHRSTVPLSDQTRTATGCSQWLLESAEDAGTPIYHFNNLAVFLCGQESFAKIAGDIRRARKSIDIIAWGFDPAMELIRGDKGGSWPRGGTSVNDTSTTYGDLLRAAVQRGVKVRLLVWYDPLLNLAMGNMPGYKTNNGSKGQPGDTYARGANTPLGASADARRDQSPEARRATFNASWYHDTVSGRIEGLSLRTRGSHHADVVASLKADRGYGASPRTVAENTTLELTATHHQKTIVIDYDSTDADAPPVAYVMGLNSVTDYWDTPAHTFNDPLRGQNHEGDGADHSVGSGWEYASSGQATLKPYQDFVCRIKGQAIAPVFKNFVEAWNTARQQDACAGSNDARRVDLKSVPKNLTQHIQGPCQRVQIVRTLPSADGGGEHAIERTYYQASSFARHFIYIENQYFQNSDWARYLKDQRKKYVQGLGAAGVPVTRVPTLHVMAVTPTPERGQMVPRTHDVVTDLGQGDSMPEQDKRIKQELAAHAQYKRDMADYQAKKKSFEAKGLPFPMSPPHAQPLSELAKAHQASSGDKDAQAVRDELANTLGMRTLVCSLWTYDREWSLGKTKVGRQADLERRDYERALRERGRAEADRAAAQARNVSLGGWENHTDSQAPIPQPPDRSKQLQQATAQRYREIYIHSKLMIIDDAFFTLGSANLNLRSFAVDSEMNMASDNWAAATALRQRVWAQHTAGLKDMDGGTDAADQKVLGKTFEKWETEAKDNATRKLKGHALSCSLVKFFDDRTSTIRFG
ncbi:phospholipase D-like domain-containing protein [Variovorax ginsengisoli]|uniref:Phosphatidylserine/phosphatidylglycerophosphate/ cardiolipin synthase-like enzyme n=1 Tax=Variovorax ginsengisoli TaxID=363844 RepID=A0ABT9S590_9BURK|nr:phospholipase D-like domain-containing protein [Variovorax ginsengisoli]MDP9899529.1 phosphatidylserine/phosphatidylglycerophosphate/cardiolipin synthase-like enzyme [Variovorax ginsengisoli]